MKAMSSGPEYCMRFFLLSMLMSATTPLPKVVCVSGETYIQIVLKVVACSCRKSARSVHVKVGQESVDVNQDRMPFIRRAVHADLRRGVRQLVFLDINLLKYWVSEATYQCCRHSRRSARARGASRPRQGRLCELCGVPKLSSPAFDARLASVSVKDPASVSILRFLLLALS